MEPTLNFSFPITTYGELSQYSNTISRGRVRIFYKGLNRNSTFITDEVAEKLRKSLPYCPVCGIYNLEEKDFVDHGQERSESKIYGFVPLQPNDSYEKHLDEDGVERDYLCCDVLLWTERNNEAKEIIGKSQSMELYPKTIEGEWKKIDGKDVYVFSNAEFFGLQALGEKVEPCFEGAAFFNLNEVFKEMVNELKILNHSLNNKDNEGGKDKMEINFKLSDSQKHNILFNLLNPNFNEENGYEIKYSICDIYDEYALAYDYENSSYIRAYYTKNNESDEVTLGEVVKAYIVDVTEAEYNALNSLKALNNDSFEKIDEAFSGKDATISERDATISTLNEQLNAANEEKEAKNEENLTLSTKIEELNTEINTLNIDKNSLSEEVSALKEYKKDIEVKQKEEAIGEYSEILSEEVISEFKNNMENYSVEDLKKELAFSLVKNNPSIFSKDNGTIRVPTGQKEEELSGAGRLLKNYINKNRTNGGEE